MLHKIADELERFDASIDVINKEQAKSAIEAALGVVRVLLRAMTVEVFYVSEKLRGDNTRYGKTVPHCLRFAKVLDDSEREALAKQSRDEYDLNSDGTWTWSYEKNSEVWVEDRWVEYIDNNTKLRRPSHNEPVAMENRIPMENMAANEGDDRRIDRRHNRFWDSVNAVIVIPFFYKIGSTFENASTNGLISHQTNGFISFEFKTPKKYDQEQLDQLLRIRESVADLIWKSHAWNDSFHGTNHAVAKFKEECSRAQKSSLPTKTGLFAPERQGYERLIELIQRTFTDSGIDIKRYDGVSDDLGLLQDSQNTTKNIRNVHFAVFDITEKNLVVDMLVGVMFAERKPCLILHENSEVARHPLMKRLAERTEQDTDRLLYLWFYERQPNGEGYLFFRSRQRERRPWEEVWEEFLCKVREISSTFRIADDFTG